MTPDPWTVHFTANASAHVEAIDAWWTQHREDASDLFLDELSAAIDRLTQLPGLGAPFESSVPGLRRVLLPRCRYHLYYTVHPMRREVLVRAVWHAGRGRSPELT